jgi:hypothetical protein
MAVTGSDGSSEHGRTPSRPLERTIGGPDGATPVPIGVILGAVLRATAFIVVLSLIYLLLPLNESVVTTAAVIVLCAIGLTVFIVIFLRRLIAITRSRHPYITGGEALVEVLAVFIVVFAIVHLAISDAAPSSYTEPLDRVAAIYFAVTVLTTVGFGDIAPVATGARVATTIQMIVDLFLIAIAARVILGVARRSKERRDRELQATEDEPVEP